ncbi:MAG: hypothetical protein ACSHX9_09405 [Luteolibacter sp.]
MNPITSLTAILALSASAQAAVVLTYDSNVPTTPTTRAANVVNTYSLVEQSGTNTAFVANQVGEITQGSSVGDRGTANVGQGFTTANGLDDSMWSFQNATIATDLTTAIDVDYATNGGNWLGVTFDASQNLIIDAISFNMYVNSGGGGTAARDTGIFVSVAGGAFTQFGNISNNVAVGGTSATLISETGSVAASAGETIEVRYVFSNRTSDNTARQGQTRVGNIQISAIPEPSAALLGAIGALMLLRRRK